jgi:hypothetical protein
MPDTGSQIQKPMSKRTQYEMIRAQLEAERASFVPHWRDLCDYVLPRRGRFFVSDSNKGDRRNQKIIDSTATLAARTLRSGMMSGVTSPARPWFRLTTPDPGLAEFAPVKDWLYFVSQRMSTVFLKSNLYNMIPITYGDLGNFGTGAMSLEEDFDDVVRFYSFPVGSYMLANDEKLRVNTFFRDFQMTVQQIVRKFGMTDTRTGAARWDNISPMVKNLWDKSEYEVWINVRHIIRPNENFDPRKLESKFKRFSSCYYEGGSTAGGGTGSVDSDERFLSEKGYDYFPILCPRWEVTGEDAYGTSCPGMDALGDIKALQIMQKRKAQAIEKMVNPPMTAPTALRNQKTSILPGDITYVDVRDGQQGFKPAQEIRFSVSEVMQDIKEHQDRIRRAFYEDLFLMLAESDRRQITAREIEERHEEKLLALGPVLEQLNQDLLDPLIENTFNIMLRQSTDAHGNWLPHAALPPPPDELKGIDLKVEYISMMAQAQKLIGIEGVERFATFAQNIVAADPEAADKIDRDKMLEIYGDMTSVPPGIIRTDDQVQQIRAQRQQQQAQAQKLQMMQQGADTAQKLSQTDTSGDNALTRMLQQSKAGQLEPQQ